MSEENQPLMIKPQGVVAFGAELDSLFDSAAQAPVQQVEPQAPVVEPAAKAPPVAPESVPEIPAPDNPNLAVDAPEETVAADEKPDEDEFPDEAPDPTIDQRKANESWKKIKAANKERKRQVAELEARVKAAEERAAGVPVAKPEEIEALSTKVAEYEARITALQNDLSVTRVDKHPDYVAKVANPIADAVKTVKKLAAKYDVNEARLATALKSGDEKSLEEMIDGFSTLDAGLVATAYRDVERANAAREDMESRAGELVAQMDRDNLAGRAIRDDRMKHDFKAAVGGAIESLRTAHGVLRKVEGNEAWNAGLDQVAKRLAETDPNALSTEQVAAAVAKEAHFPYLESAYNYRTTQVQNLQKRLAAAEATVKSLRAVDAGMGMGGTKQPEDTTREQIKKDASLSFADSLEKRLAELGAH